MGKTSKNAKSIWALVFVLLLFPLMWCNPVSAVGEEGAGEEGAEEAPKAVGNKYSFHVGGYVRTWASVNLKNQPETEGFPGGDYNDSGKLSMLRGSLRLNAEAKAGPFTFVVIGRGDQEVKTEYLKHMERMIQTGYDNFGSLNMRDSAGTEIMDAYNQGEFREYYVEFEPFQRLKLRLGRQQVVWGETDFFRAMDVVHGFDYRWRLFLEPENEELRKPLILANATVQVPEVDGSLQVIFRPGAINRPSWGSNTYDLTGGRWMVQPARALDMMGVVKYDYDHPDGDFDDATWGVRWAGIAGPINYSLAYLKTFSNDPVANSGMPEFAYEKQATGLAEDLIYPKIELVGATASGYAPWLDAILSTEVVYTFNDPYNVGTGEGGSIDSLEGNNLGPALLGKAFANLLPGDTATRQFSGPDVNQALGVIDRVLKPQGFTDDLLWTYVVPAGMALYDGVFAGVPGYEALKQQPNPTRDWDIARQNLANGFYNYHKLIPGYLPLLVDWVPGLKGIKKKDSLMVMLRMDKNLAFTQRLLGTNKPSFFTVQAFNHVILDYDYEEDDIVRFPTFGERRKKIETMLTGVLALTYRNDTINPTLAAGWDVSYGGAFVIPSVEFVYGDHWRLRLEADLFFPSGQKEPATINDAWLDLTPLDGWAGGLKKYELGNLGVNENSTSFLGYFADSDQVAIRLTYQF